MSNHNLPVEVITWDTELLREVASDIEADKGRHFNMSFWFINPNGPRIRTSGGLLRTDVSCGTTACIAGFTLLRRNKSAILYTKLPTNSIPAWAGDLLIVAPDYVRADGLALFLESKWPMLGTGNLANAAVALLRALADGTITLDTNEVWHHIDGRKYESVRNWDRDGIWDTL